MNFGTFRHRVTIEKNTETRTATGQASAGWSTHGTRRASFRETAGSETFDESRRIATRTAEFQFRYLAGVVPKMRISHDSRLFEIDYVVADDLKRFQTAVCTEHDV